MESEDEILLHIFRADYVSSLNIDGLMQERRYSIANPLELRLSCTNSWSPRMTSAFTKDQTSGWIIVKSFLYKMRQIPKLNGFSPHLAVALAQYIEAGCCSWNMRCFKYILVIKMFIFY